MLKPRILDTTLRDGSYVINFQFTARDTAIISGKLDEAGFELIEIGHGVWAWCIRRRLRASSRDR